MTKTKTSKSMRVLASRCDIVTTFKIEALKKGMSFKDALDEAMKLWLKPSIPSKN